MIERRLGLTGPITSALGLGCMGMSDFYGPADETESLATVHAALEAGITLLDTGDFYGMGHNELLLRKALRGKRDNVLLSVKFGALRAPDGSFLGFDARPAAVKTALSYTLQRLGTEYIDIYRPARLDANVPIEDTIGAIADLVKQGYVRHIGLSEVSAATMRRAAAVHPIVDLQIEYSIATRGIEKEILPAAREQGIAITAYGILSRGLLTSTKPTSPSDLRSHYPRFNQAGNQERVDVLNGLAARKGVTPAQLATAWVMAQGTDIIPLVGARTRLRLEESLGALAITLSDAELGELDAAFPNGAFAGNRYPDAQMAHLDSERTTA